MGKIYCCSDLHGQYKLFKQIKEFLKEDDTCYILGDCVDRGPGSIKILLDIIVDKRFKMIKGNHEQMMLEALDSAEEGIMDFQHWYGNGGYKTHMELMEYERGIQLEILSFIRKLDVKVEYKDIVLTHAGYSFSLEEYVLDDILDEDRLLWDRSHIEGKSVSKFGKVQVHGHTPSGLIVDGAEGILQYSKGKWCVDTGCCFGHKAGILDLDTFEETYFGHE